MKFKVGEEYLTRNGTRARIYATDGAAVICKAIPIEIDV